MLLTKTHIHVSLTPPERDQEFHPQRAEVILPASYSGAQALTLGGEHLDCYPPGPLACISLVRELSQW